MTVKAVSFDFWWTLYRDVSGTAGGAVRKDRIKLIQKTASKLNSKHVSYQRAKDAFLEGRKLFEKNHPNAIFTPSEEVVKAIFKNMEIDVQNHIVRNIAYQMGVMGRNATLKLNKNVLKILPELKRNYRIGLISDTVLTPGQHLAAKMRASGILHYFDVLAFSDQLGAVKPDTEVFNYILAKFKCRPEEVVHIGDFPWSDIEGAKRAGMYAVQYTGGGSPENNNIHPKSDFVIEDFKNLPGIVSSL